MSATEPQPLLRVDGVTHYYGRALGCTDVSFELWPGEVVAIVGESGSGKTTLLKCLSGQLPPSRGRVRYHRRDGAVADIYALGEPERRHIMRTEWGFIFQDPRDGLRMGISAGANIGERLMAVGERHYGRIRGKAVSWFDRVELDGDRIDQDPRTFSGGMRQRLQLARNLVSSPRLVFMDEPTGGLDVSVQARVLDLVRRLVRDFDLSVIIVTHDLGVARLLSERMIVMQQGRLIEIGLTDRLLDDPREPYTQTLVSAVLT